jgi:hypothetical protein
MKTAMMMPVGIMARTVKARPAAGWVPWILFRLSEERAKIQANGSTKVRRISTHSGQGRRFMPRAIATGAKSISRKSMNTTPGTMVE